MHAVCIMWTVLTTSCSGGDSTPHQASIEVVGTTLYYCGTEFYGYDMRARISNEDDEEVELNGIELLSESDSVTGEPILSGTLVIDADFAVLGSGEHDEYLCWDGVDVTYPRSVVEECDLSVTLVYTPASSGQTRSTTVTAPLWISYGDDGCDTPSYYRECAPD